VKGRGYRIDGTDEAQAAGEVMDTDDKTPIATREGSRVAQAIGDLLDELARIERDLRPMARVVDQLTEVELRALLERLMPRLRQVGELGHLSARVVWNILHERRGKKRG
jgi:hypothetical protein